MEWHDKFATDDRWNSMALTSDGCMNRMVDTSPFRDQELVMNEAIRYNTIADRDERAVLNQLAMLTRRGLQPKPNQSIESFVAEHLDVLSSNI
jgi:hypothetical protein